jgi:hypothetical protein
MKTKNVVVAETSKVKSNVETNKEMFNADILNKLEKINTASLLSAVSSKKTIYKYSDEMIQKNDESLFKKFRKNIRKEKHNICVSILTNAKEKNIVELNKSIETFMIFYKKNFIINDFSLENFSNTDKNKDIYSLALEIVKNKMTAKK